MKDNESLYIKQNDNELLEINLLFGNCYNRAKRIKAIVILFRLIIPIILNIILLFVSNNMLILGLSSATIIILYVISEILIYKVTKYKNGGAVSQYYYECLLYNLPYDKETYRAKNILSKNEMIELYQSFKSSSNKVKENWFSNFSILDNYNQIIECLKENIRYDKRLRTRFLYFISISTLIIAIIILIFFLIFNDSINYLVYYILTFSIVIEFVYTEVRTLKSNLNNQRKISDRIEILERKINSNYQNIDMFLLGLEIDMIEYRKNLLLIPTWFYNINKKSDHEKEDNYSNNILPKK